MNREIHRFFHEADLSVGTRILLTDPNARIARSVLRLKPRDRITLLDGRGQVATAELREVGKRQVTAEIVDRTELSRPHPLITLLQGFPKGEKSDWIVQKSVEFGVKRVLFFESGRTIPKRSAGQRERWRRVAVEAMRQSGNPHLPSVEGPVSLKESLTNPEGLRFFLDESERERTLREVIGSETPSSVCVAVGPEGGWSDEDRELLGSSGFAPITVGPFTLRTETAAVAALALVRATWPGFR